MSVTLHCDALRPDKIQNERLKTTVAHRERERESYFTTGDLPPISSSWRRAPWGSRHSNFIFQLNTCGCSPYVTSSLMIGWLCRLQLLLVLSSAQSFSGPSPAGLMTTFYYLRFESPPTCQGQVPVFVSRRKRVARLYPHREVSE
jgi:hypothetical protein